MFPILSHYFISFPILSISISMSYPIIITFIDPGKPLTPWVLALEQEPYLLYLKKVIKKILQTKDPSHSSLDDFSNIHIIFPFLNIIYITLHNGHFIAWKQISCCQKKYIVHTFYYTWHNSCLTHLTNSQLSFLWILFHRVDLDFIFSALHMFGYENKFVHIVQVGYTNNQTKINLNGLN